MKNLFFSVLLVILMVSPSITIAANVFYSPDLQAAYNKAFTECKKHPTGPGDIPYRFQNPIDSTQYFECPAEGDYEGVPVLGSCLPWHQGHYVTERGFSYPLIIFYLIGAGQDLPYEGECNWFYPYPEPDFADSTIYAQGKCTADTKCDCRDNVDILHRSGSCSCFLSEGLGYGWTLNYSTCTATVCPVIKDINGVNAEKFISDYYPNPIDYGKCVAQTGYTFLDTAGQYEFKSNCSYTD